MLQILVNSTNQLFKDWRIILYVALLLLPTYYFGNDLFILLLPLTIILLNYRIIVKLLKTTIKNPINGKVFRYLFFPLLVVFVSLINKFFNGGQIICWRDYYASFMLLPFLLLSSYFLKERKIYFYLLIFIFIEVVFSVFEYFLNVRNIFPINREVNVISSKALLYDSRVFGLSVNSSMLALKVFCGIILIEYVKLKKYLKYLFYLGLITGLVLTFSRGMILAVLVFWFLLFVKLIIENRKELRILFSHQTFIVLALFFSVVLIFHNSFRYQFSRGESVENLVLGDVPSEQLVDQDVKEEMENTCYNEFVPEITQVKSNLEQLVDQDVKEEIENTCYNEFVPEITQVKSNLDTTGRFVQFFLERTKSINSSGRSVIWLNYVNFIEKNPWFGNGSNKLMFNEYNAKLNKIEKVHAHNSFLELLATNGIPIFILYIVMYFLLWKGKNLIPILSILVYSLTQYGIFWGYSILDVIFVLLLILPKSIFDVENEGNRSLT